MNLRALPYHKCRDALESIEATQAALASKMCLRLIILTACRYGEARHATWNEIDMDTATWMIPASRMKARREHKIALSSEALRVLQAAQEISDGSGLISPSPLKQGKPISEYTLTKVLKSAQLAEGITLHSKTTVHGFRTTFRVWAEEQSSASHAAKELSLAHAVGSAVEQAYLRSDLLDQRRALMQEWADFLNEKPT